MLETPDHKNLCDWSPDGRYVLFSSQDAKTGRDLWMLPLFGDRTPRPIATGMADEARARFSPDGRWISYESRESGRFEIYVQSFPDLGQKVQVSTAGGSSATWRGDGREMYFASPDDRMMAVAVTATPTQFDSGVPAVSLRCRPLQIARTEATRGMPHRATVSGFSSTLSLTGIRPSRFS